MWLNLRRPLSRRHLRAFVPLTAVFLFFGFAAPVISEVAIRDAVAAARPSFAVWREGLWPEAEALGISRSTFDAAFKGLKPDYSLPDLKRPGQKVASSRGQAEFTRPPSAYVDRGYIMRLAKTGRRLAGKHAAVLDRIEKEIGVDRSSVLAIWGRETAFGAHKLRHDAVRVLATQAYAGRRAMRFRKELLAALKLLQSGVPRSRMKSSWAGAMGLTQFMPSEFFEHARDFDGDGEANVFSSVPDALASAASQLAGKGWVRGQTWGYEVVVPPTSDCSLEGPGEERPLSDWAALGFKRVGGRKWPQHVMAHSAYLMMPAGAYGPAFLVLENFKVFRRYNMSDLYAVFVGHLADRISGGSDFVTPWSSNERQRTGVIADIQSRLLKAGYAVSVVDGKIGSNTRHVVGTYQRLNGLKVDCWPSRRVLKTLQARPPKPYAVTQ